MIFSWHNLCRLRSLLIFFKEWDKATQQLIDEDEEKYHLAAVDCDAWADLRQKYNATYIPHINYFKNGELLYNNLGTEFRRNQEGIIKYLSLVKKYVSRRF